MNKSAWIANPSQMRRPACAEKHGLGENVLELSRLEVAHNNNLFHMSEAILQVHKAENATSRLRSASMSTLPTRPLTTVRGSVVTYAQINSSSLKLMKRAAPASPRSIFSTKSESALGWRSMLRTGCVKSTKTGLPWAHTKRCDPRGCPDGISKAHRSKQELQQWKQQLQAHWHWPWPPGLGRQPGGEKEVRISSALYQINQHTLAGAAG